MYSIYDIHFSCTNVKKSVINIHLYTNNEQCAYTYYRTYIVFTIYIYMYSFLRINERTCTNVHLYSYMYTSKTNIFITHIPFMHKWESIQTCIYICYYIYIYKCRYAEDSCWLLLYPARSHYALRTIVGIPLSGLEWFIHVDQLFS